ncbi:MAG: glycosyltransferase [Deltaproteobacteria bacterium]|nr:glycosyltransferase [Deltaproteobacteria bacterium]
MAKKLDKGLHLSSFYSSVFLLKTIGIVIATYNGERYLYEQIDSIFSQSLQPDKIIVVDDCSTDGTTDIIAKYRKKYPEIIVFVQNEKNLGYVKTFERGISRCQTDYIALSDQDDIWKPNKIQNCYHALEHHTDAKLCFHDLEFIDGDGNSIGKNFWESSLIPLPVIWCSCKKTISESDRFSSWMHDLFFI